MSISVMIDVVIAAVLVLCAAVGWKRGLIRSLAELSVMVVALFLANQIASAAAPVIVDRTLRPATYAAIEQQVDKMMAEDISVTTPVEELLRVVDGIPNSFVREHVRSLVEDMGLSTVRQASYSAQETLLRLGYQIADSALDGVVRDLVRSIVCAVCFAILTAALRMIVKALRMAVKLPVLKQLNELGGLLLGVGKGLLLVCLGVWVLRLTGIITQEMAEKSLLIGAFSSWTAGL